MDKTNFSDEEMKKKLLEMFKWFHAFCKENMIRYYVIDGTMLGAARHQGFIPWDDDIDIGIPRKDYERLAELMSKKTDCKYVLETPQSKASDFIYTYSKLYDSTTTLIERAKKNIVRGIFLDIFPLDGLGNSIEEAQKRFRKINLYFFLYMSRVVAVNPERKLYKNIVLKMIQLIPNFILNNKKLQLKIDKMCKTLDYDECKICGNLLGTWRFRDVMDKDIMGKPTPYLFENQEVCGVEDYDRYLTHLYGDWKQLPPKNQQISKHSFEYCNLYESYKAL